MPKFVPRVRKQKARELLNQQNAASNHGAQANPNAAEIVPESKIEREDRRQRMKDELLASQPVSKASSKKRKRLDKYIETKLKKEERLDLIKKLEEQSSSTDLLKSSKNLGRGRATKREAIQQAFRHHEAGINAAKNEGIIFERRRTEQASDGGDSSEAQDSASDAELHGVQLAFSSSTPAVQPLQVGSGLKRKLDIDEAGLPIIQKRVRKKGPAIRKARQSSSHEKDSGWEGFASDQDSEDVAGSTTSEASQSSDDEADSESSDGDEGSPEEQEESDGEDPISDGDKDQEVRNERSSAFKAWATQMRNDATGFKPSTNTEMLPTATEYPVPKTIVGTPKVGASSNDPIGSATLENKSLPRSIYNVTVQREESIQTARLELPVVAEEQKIMEAVFNNDCIIIHGATGSGKTTQVPQFLFEAGFGSKDSSTPGIIGVTQPRRVAAVSMAKRVGRELGQHDNRVAHQVRFDSSVDSNTAIKFMTDGVLLREISQDFTLSKYSVIVIDEAHERSVNTDILIGMLTRVVETRSTLAAKYPDKCKALKLIIMSATLRLTDFSENKVLFRQSPPPVVQAEGRQHPVTIHWTRKTSRDYLEDAYNKICSGHKKLPAGGMLVFLTGQNEIHHLRHLLTDKFTATDECSTRAPNVRMSVSQVSVEDEDLHLSSHVDVKSNHGFDDDDDEEVEIKGLDNDEENEFDIGDEPDQLLKIHVLPLYSQLPTEQQLRVFDPPPDGSRLIVLATNVAETSLTIPGIRYVFDTGRAKERQYDLITGVQTFDIHWISKASAEQRAGRAGRTGPGHCYRLYSSAVYENHFPKFAVPEINRTPVEGVVLQLKSMGIPKVAAFPFPTPPNRTGLIQAEKLLNYLGAVVDNKITALGRELSHFPLSPRLARIIILAVNAGCIERALSLVSVLAVPDLFIPESQLDLQDHAQELADNERWTEADNIKAHEQEQKRREYNAFHAQCARFDKHSDAIKLLTALCDFTNDSMSNQFEQFARVKAFKEAIQLRTQLARIVNAKKPGALSDIGGPSNAPSSTQIKTLRRIIAAGYVDQIAIRADASPSPPSDPSLRKPKRAVDVPYITLFSSFDATTRSAAAETKSGEGHTRFAYIHASSVLSRTSPQKLPTYIVYSHLSRSAPTVIAGTKQMKTRLHPLVPATSDQLAKLATDTPLLQEGKPIGKIESMTRGEDGSERRSFWSTPFLVPGEGGGIGWPLPPARKVVQRRIPGKGWVTESLGE